MAREKPLHEQMVQFCKHHLGKECFAPLTGQDWPAWTAFVYLLQCLAHGGGDTAIAAMRATVASAQRTEAVLRVFAQAIPGVMDWGDVARLWPRIADGITTYGGLDARTLFAIERNEFYRGDSKHIQEKRTAWGWRPAPVVAEGASP